MSWAWYVWEVEPRLKQLTPQKQAVFLPEGATGIFNFATVFWFHHLSLKFRVTIGIWLGAWATTAQRKHTEMEQRQGYISSKDSLPIVLFLQESY